MLEKPLLMEMLRRMLRIRHFEEAVVSLVERGEIVGAAHSYIGEEAVAVGACLALEPMAPATSPEPTTSKRESATSPKMRRVSSQMTLPRFTCPREIPVWVRAHLAAWKLFWKTRFNILPALLRRRASS